MDSRLKAFGFVMGAVALTIVLMFLGPTVSFWANGQNIVGDSQSASAYVATSVGILGAILSAGAAFVAYEWRKWDEQQLKSRTCAILIKTAIRGPIREAHRLFQLCLSATSKDDWPKFIGGAHFPELKIVDEAKGQLALAEWAGVSTSIDLTADAAEALSHLDSRYLSRFLTAYGFWERVCGSKLKTANQFHVVAHCTEVALRNLLELNHLLNEVAIEGYADLPDERKVRSTTQFLREFPLPLPV